MTQRSALSALGLLLALLLILPAVPGSATGVALAPRPLEPATTGGLAVVERGLAKLSVHRRLLLIAAHPDDEDTALLSLVSRGLGGEAGYLSLSRGDGGQNLIGPELGVGLGLIRSQELMSARGVDGGRQFFTRAYDFGFTPSVEEALRLWPKEVLVEDAVRVIRRFKPQVVVSTFPDPTTTKYDSHGQHKAAGATAFAAFPLAGDPKALPQLAAEGLSPWTPQALYRSTWFDVKSTTLTMPIGGIDPLTGRSVFQLAMASRSMHRSQAMGQLQEMGPRDTRLGWIQGGAGAAGKDLFAGIDTRPRAIVASLLPEARRSRAAEHLDAVEQLASQARAGLVAERLGEAVPSLAKILGHLRAVAGIVAGGGEADRPVGELIAEKIEVAQVALAAAAGVAVDATSDREALIAGETFPVRATLYANGTLPVGEASVTLVPSAEWPDAVAAAGEAKAVGAGAVGVWELKPAVPAKAPATVPYFLRRPLAGSLYDWSAARPEERGEPFGPPVLTARFRFKIGDTEVTLEREVVYRHRDPILGEVRRPLRVVPRVEVAVAENLLAWPVDQRAPRRLEVVLTSHSKSALSGRLELVAGPGASPIHVAPQPFTLPATEANDGQPVRVALSLDPAKGLAPGRYPLRLAAVLADGERFDLAVPLLDYPHIRPTPNPSRATVEVSALDLKLPKLARVGYVRGASDRVPEFLRQAGVPVELLGAAELAGGDLSRYDAIVVGSRAYETDPALVRANGRLLDYVKAGGLAIVQYQQYPFIDGGYAPFKLEIARPHDRVTDETAKVTVLDPASLVFSTPNRIGEADWEGWVQERGLYFAHTWDPAYQPLLAMADPGGPEQRGALLVAQLGKGRYVYTGLALFRQLPAGVPGAYRLFANLLALGR